MIKMIEKIWEPMSAEDEKELNRLRMKINKKINPQIYDLEWNGRVEIEKYKK
jgi:hypothetical protein